MSNEDEQQTEGEEVVEIDDEALEAMIKTLESSDLDLSNHLNVVDHIGVLLGIYLRKVEAEAGHGEDELSDLAASAAGLAIQIAFEDEDLPSFK